jgi:ABC-type phosphate/phosphonate transport system substrate-binding protein
MYSVSPEAANRWRALLGALIDQARLPMTLLDYEAPAPMHALWERQDLGAVLMCGLPFSRTVAQPNLLAAPVPALAEYGGIARYWSAWVVRSSGPIRRLEQSYGGRLALTMADSQSGFAAPLYHLMSQPGPLPRYREVIAPAVTPRGALLAVIEGEADIAPLDSYALALLARFEPALTAQIRVVAHTEPTPIPPFVSSQPAPAALQAAFLKAHARPVCKPLMDDLLLERFDKVEPGAYAGLRDRHAAAVQYWTQHPLATRMHPAFGL